MAKKKTSKAKNKPIHKYRFGKEDVLCCPTCKHRYTVNEWNDNSLEKFSSREIRRDFRSIATIEAGRKGNEKEVYYFYCKNCNMLIPGCLFNKNSVCKEDNNDNT